MPAKTVVLKTDTQLRKVLTKGLILTMPYWLLFGGGVTLVSLISWRIDSGGVGLYNQLWYVMASMSFGFCSIMSVYAMQNRILVKEKSISFPSPSWQTIPLAHIKRVEIFSKSGERFVRLKKADASATTFPLSYLDDEQKDVLLKTLRDRCGAEVVPDSLSLEHDFFSEDTCGEYRIKYQVTTRLKNFMDSLKEVDRLFWKLWFAVCIFPIVLALPAMPYLINLFITRHANSSMNEYVEAFYRLVGYVTQHSINTYVNSTAWYFACMEHPVFLTLAVLLFLLLVFLIGAHLLQPNLLKLTKKGVELCYKVFAQEIRLHLVQWNEIKGFSLVKPGDATDSSKWYINVAFRNSDASGRLNYSSFSHEIDRLRFMKAVKKFAPDATVDAEMAQSFTSTNKRSYTELWLQTLASPSSRKNFVPLSEGALLLDGKYRIKEPLGVGGQGIAYLAYDTFSSIANREDSDNLVVLKEFVLPVHAESSIRVQALERFNREAEILQKLDHPGVVKIRDYFMEDHRGYLVLEHIDGLSLRRQVQEGRSFDEPELKALVEQMCEMLRYLTSLTPQIVHRDFTPDNLLVGVDGVLKLIDFNVAHQKQGSSTATVVGKHAYLPPEQFRGQPSIRSDIYALGCTLYFLITARDPEPLTQSELPNAETTFLKKLSAIIAKCTAIDEKDRFASAAEIMSMLAEESNDPIPLIEQVPEPEAVVETLEERDTITVPRGA